MLAWMVPLCKKLSRVIAECMDQNTGLSNLTMQESWEVSVHKARCWQILSTSLQKSKNLLGLVLHYMTYKMLVPGAAVSL